MNTAELKVGDFVYFASAVRYMNSNTVQVVKVGRKWIELSNSCRVERGSTVCDNKGVGSSPGSIWPDEAAYRLCRIQQARWAMVRDHVRNVWAMPRHLTDEDLSEMERILRLNAEAS